MSDIQKLKEQRAEIDKVDAQILKKLKKRAELAQKIGRLKQKSGRDLHQPTRERAVLRRLKDDNRAIGSPLDDEHIEAIYREIMSACLAKEHRLKIAYLGPAGTFSEEAARRKFGASAHYRPKPSVEEVFKSVTSGEFEYGLVPLRNSKAGAVNATMQAFIHHGMKGIRLHSNVILPIRLHLVANCKSTLTNIQRVLAHPVAQTQCADNLSALLPEGVTYKASASNAEAAVRLKAASKSKNLAALVPHGDADDSGLYVLREDMQDEADSATHFLVLNSTKKSPSPEEIPARELRRHLIMAAIRDEVGALMKLLRCFETRKINLCNLDVIKHGALYFLIEFESTGKKISSGELSRLIKELERESKQLIDLGHCPAKEFH